MLLYFQRRVGAELAGLLVKLKLVDHVGTKKISGRVHHTVVHACDMGHEGELVRAVSLDGVGRGRGFQPFDVWTAQ